MSATTMPCAGCGRPVELSRPHITVNRRVERHRKGGIDVLDAETIGWLHLPCSYGVGEDQAGVEIGVVSADEPIPFVLTEVAVGVSCDG